MTTAAANIGPRESRKRLAVGGVALAAGVAIAVVLIATGTPRAWRLAAAIPFWAAALGFFQARHRT